MRAQIVRVERFRSSRKNHPKMTPGFLSGRLEVFDGKSDSVHSLTAHRSTPAAERTLDQDPSEPGLSLTGITNTLSAHFLS